VNRRVAGPVGWARVRRGNAAGRRLGHPSATATRAACSGTREPSPAVRRTDAPRRSREWRAVQTPPQPRTGLPQRAEPSETTGRPWNPTREKKLTEPKHFTRHPHDPMPCALGRGPRPRAGRLVEQAGPPAGSGGNLPRAAKHEAKRDERMARTRQGARGHQGDADAAGGGRGSRGRQARQRGTTGKERGPRSQQPLC